MQALAVQNPVLGADGNVQTWVAPLETRPQIVGSGELSDGVSVLDHVPCVPGEGVANNAQGSSLAVQ